MIMRLMLIGAASLALCGAALADEVTITRHDVAPAPGVVIEHRSADVPATKEKTITEHPNGCTTKSVKKTNGVGDTMEKSKTEC